MFNKVFSSIFLFDFRMLLHVCSFAEKNRRRLNRTENEYGQKNIFFLGIWYCMREKVEIVGASIRTLGIKIQNKKWFE